MSTELPDLGSPPDRIDPELRKWLVRAREHIRELRGNTGDPAGAAGSGSGSTTVIVPGAPGPAPAPTPSDPPDLTPPPTPSGVTVTAGLAAVYISTDPPLFTQGHGYARTKVYGAKYDPGPGPTPNPLPTFANASLQHEFVGEIGSFPSDLGVQWHIWVKWLTADDVESVVPFGGTNGVQVTTGKIGTADLGPLIVEAGNLASGAVTAAKLAAGSVGLTAFAAGLTPVEVASSLPASGNFIGRMVALTTDGKLYRYTATGWTATVASSDIAGQLLDSQVAALAASKITGQLTNAQIASIAAAKLTGQITSTQITDGAISTPKLAAGAVTAATIAAETITAAQIAAEAITAAELAAGSVIAAKIAAGAVTATAIAAQAVTAGKIAANAVTANELAANSVTSAKIQAGAVTATQIAAQAIRTDKLLVTGAGAALNADPRMLDTTAWTYYAARSGSYSLVTIADGVAGDKAMRVIGDATPESLAVPLVAGRQYRVSVYARSVGGPSGLRYIRCFRRDQATTLLGFAVLAVEPAVGTFEGINFPSSWTRYVGRFTAEAGAVSGHINVDCSASETGTYELQDFRIEELVDSSLIVDGSIIATKLAANAIAVGTAAIQNGAIVNAMIADATIDSAKIATLAASKITAGSLNVGAFIQSSNYIAGVSGWRIDGTGPAEFAAASIRGQLTAAQVAAWSVSAGRAIIADGTINTAKIEDASITNAKIGDTIQSVGYSAGVSGWLIRKSDGFAEFGAATIRGKLSAGNLVGSASNSSRGSQSLTLTAGAVQFDRYILASFPLTLESDPVTSLARVEGLFEGDIVLQTNVSFSGGGGTYKAVVQAVFEFQVFNGSTWSTWANDNIVESSTTVILTGNEPIVVPLYLNDQLLLPPATYPQVRASVSVIFAGFRQLVVNGSAIKADALASATIRGRGFLRQRPN